VLTLYDNRSSTNALKVRFLLGELGLAHERVEVPLEDERPGWYREIHPFGLVPTLRDGDLFLTQSNTILRYLADREGRDDLYPRAAAARALVDTLLDALSLEVRPALWEAELATIYGGPPTDWRPALDAALSGWERLLAGGGYGTGAFSIADCAMAGRMHHLPEMPLDLARFPRTRENLEIVTARPAFREAL
jgi:glutathione S-transferase